MRNRGIKEYRKLPKFDGRLDMILILAGTEHAVFLQIYNEIYKDNINTLRFATKIDMNTLETVIKEIIRNNQQSSIFNYIEKLYENYGEKSYKAIADEICARIKIYNSLDPNIKPMVFNPRTKLPTFTIRIYDENLEYASILYHDQRIDDKVKDCMENLIISLLDMKKAECDFVKKAVSDVNLSECEINLPTKDLEMKIEACKISLAEAKYKKLKDQMDSYYANCILIEQKLKNACNNFDILLSQKKNGTREMNNLCMLCYEQCKNTIDFKCGHTVCREKAGEIVTNWYREAPNCILKCPVESCHYVLNNNEQSKINFNKCEGHADPNSIKCGLCMNEIDLMNIGIKHFNSSSNMWHCLCNKCAKEYIEQRTKGIVYEFKNSNGELETYILK